MFKRLLLWLFTPEPLTVPREAPKQPVVPPAATSSPIVPKAAPVPVPAVVVPPKPLTNREKLYIITKHHLGEHLGLDTSIPIDVNCANTVTNLLILAGVKGLPPKGIAGTSALFAWFKASKDFKEVPACLPGDVIISPTGHGNGKVTGHVGIIGEGNILSNNSDTGKLETKWTLAKWKAHYGVEGALPVKFYRWV